MIRPRYILPPRRAVLAASGLGAAGLAAGLSVAFSAPAWATMPGVFQAPDPRVELVMPMFRQPLPNATIEPPIPQFAPGSQTMGGASGSGTTQPGSSSTGSGTSGSATPGLLADLQPAIQQAATQTGVNADILTQIGAAESGGRNIGTQIMGPDGRPAATASGVWQITDGTWAGIARNNPELGLSAADRADPAKQAVGAAALAREVSDTMSRQLGRPVNGAELRTGWMMGPTYGARVLQADAAAPLNQVVPADWVSRTRLEGMTVGAYRDSMARQMGSLANVQARI